MLNCHAVFIGAVVVASFAPLTFGQPAPSTPAAKPSTPAAKPPEKQVPPTDASQKAASGSRVAATVNGEPITMAELDEKCDAIVRAQTRGRRVSPGEMTQMRARIVPQMRENLIDNRLLDEDCQRAEITLTDAEYTQEMEKLLEAHFARTGATRSEFEKQIQGQMGQSIEQFLASRATDPAFRQSVREARLLEYRYPEAFKVTPEMVAARYEQTRDSDYAKPAQVRARHILIGSSQAATGEAKVAARHKAETVLTEVKQPGSDFAALAMEYSSCPSRKQGGDLGFFPRKGVMAEPFAAAAFALDEGEVSGVVETQFGYHIIEVTEKQPAQVIPMSQASGLIEQQIRSETMGQVRQKHVAKLRETAEITYPGVEALQAKP